MLPLKRGAGKTGRVHHGQHVSIFTHSLLFENPVVPINPVEEHLIGSVLFIPQLGRSCVFVQIHLAQADTLWSHFDKLVFSDEFDGLIQ